MATYKTMYTTMCSSTRVEHKQTQTCDSGTINKYMSVGIYLMKGQYIVFLYHVYLQL